MREGIGLIQARCEVRPHGFTDAALRSLRRVATLSVRQLRVAVSAGQGEGEAVQLGADLLSGQETQLCSIGAEMDNRW